VADSDDPDEAAFRLEEALERIAALTARVKLPPAAGGAADDVEPDREPPDADVPDAGRIAARLDALIAQIRAGLAGAAER